MRKAVSSTHYSPGAHLGTGAFTLIELLIVIAILAILATGLMLALDPVEQINRATDSTRQSLAHDFISSANQFRSTKGYSAACPDIVCGTYLDSLSVAPGSPPTLSTMATVNTNMFATGNADGPNVFISHPQSSKLYVSLTNASPSIDASLVVCWQPASKINRANANVNDPSSTIYNNIGQTQSSTSCPATSSNTCYQCIR